MLLNSYSEATIKTISILGTGWLGLPLAQHFVSMGHNVIGSTTSKHRLTELTSIGVKPFLIDIGSLPDTIQEFLQADVLIINIPSKDIAGFRLLAQAIEKSALKNIVFVSSTSVYDNTNTVITEADGLESEQSPLVIIENLLKKCNTAKTTIVRFGGLIGHSRNPGNFFRKGRKVQHPDSRVNLIHRDDCIAIITQIIEQEVWGEVFNCCADTHPTKREFYTQAATSIGNPAPEFILTGTSPYKIISNQKVKQRLHYQFLHPDLMKIQFEDAL